MQEFPKREVQIRGCVQVRPLQYDLNGPASEPWEATPALQKGYRSRIREDRKGTKGEDGQGTQPNDRRERSHDPLAHVQFTRYYQAVREIGIWGRAPF